MEYAIRQYAALVNQGVEVHFLCRESFPKGRLADGIVVENFVESRVSRVQRRGLAGKIFRVWRMIFDLRSEANQVVELAHQIAQTSSTRHRPGSAEVAILFSCDKEYFAELMNPIPRVLWPGKPLIGIDYAIARGQGWEGGKWGGLPAWVQRSRQG